jgi:hypothetical protein
MENYKVDYKHSIKKGQEKVNTMSSDGTLGHYFKDIHSGTISVWEQRILKKWKGNTMYCTVTDQEDLIEYMVDVTHRGNAYEGMSYEINCNGKTNEGHWISFFVTLGGGSKGEVFVEPIEASEDPEFDYNDLHDAIIDYAENNLYK